MSTVNENPIAEETKPAAPQAPDKPVEEKQAERNHAEESQADEKQAGQKPQADSPPRPSREALLPEMAGLSLEGHSNRTIGKKLGVPRRTVDRWLLELRRQWAACAAENAADLFPVALARLETLYREAMEAWRRSLADKHVMVESAGDEGKAKAKNSLRTETQSGQAALLGKAIQAAKEICAFNAKLLDAERQARSRKWDFTRPQLVEELYRLPKKELEEVLDLVRERQANGAPRRPTHDLARELCNLTKAEYHELREELWEEHDCEVPLRRAGPGPQCAVAC